MPRGDGTGPAGAGPMTGRAAGYCAGYNMPGFMNPVGGRFGRGMGWGRGFGRGRGWRSWGTYPAYAPSDYGMPPTYPPPTPEQEVDSLRNQAQFLSHQLNQIQKRISELEAGAKKPSK